MKPRLQKHTGTLLYGQKVIPFHFWSHSNDGIAPIDAVIFLGTSQTGRIAKWVAGNAPTGTVVVEGLPHKEADRSAHDLKEFARDYTSAAFLAVLKECNISSAHVIAESQGAPGAIWVALDYVDHVKNVALIAPLGFSAHILGSSPEKRLKELKRRAFQSSLQFAQSPLYNVRNAYLSLLMLNAVLFDAQWKVSGQKYAVGASHDLREDCYKLVDQLRQRGSSLTFILGERDKLFPPAEIVASLKEAGIGPANIIILKTSHASLAIRDGKHILRRAIEAVRC
jgi:pimeloyl-ACP methyl ester carboxylesterase